MRSSKLVIFEVELFQVVKKVTSLPLVMNFKNAQ